MGSDRQFDLHSCWTFHFLPSGVKVVSFLQALSEVRTDKSRISKTRTIEVTEKGRVFPEGLEEPPSLSWMVPGS